MSDSNYNLTSKKPSTQTAALTASKALASDANGNVVASSTSATELGYVAGVTSSIQTQINNAAFGTQTLTISSGSIDSTGLTSTSWADLGSGSVSITTNVNNASILISYSGYLDQPSAGGNQVFAFGVSIDGTDYGISSTRFGTGDNDNAVPFQVFFSHIVPTAKTLTVKARYLVTGSTFRVFESSTGAVSDSSNIKTFRVLQFG